MSKRIKIFSGFIGIISIVAFCGFLNNVLKKDHRKLQVTFEYKLDLKSKAGSQFELTSLVPQSIKGRQKVGEISYSPEPYKIFKRNGNLYATWKFKGKYMPKRVEMRCVIDIWRYKLDNQKPGKRLSVNEKRMFLRREKYIDVGKRSIKKAAYSVGKYKTDSELARALTIFVLKRMKPIKASVKAFGAVKALKYGKGDCTEYSDLLVSLARQRGLPAKHISGYMMGKQSNIGHSWVEIYTRDRGWIMVDPLQIDLKSGIFKQLYNKYIALSCIRWDRVLDDGMIYHWSVANLPGARVAAGVKVRDLN